MQDLIDMIKQYSIDYNWYELVDNVGNIETDNDSKEEFEKQIRYSLENDIESVIEYFSEDIQEAKSKKQFEDAYSIWDKLYDLREQHRENELKNDIEIIIKLYDYLNLSNVDIEYMIEDYKNDYLTLNRGRDGKDYYYYFDGDKEGIIRIEDNEIITDKKVIEDLFC